MNFFDEMKEMGLSVESSSSKVHCKLFKDNSGVLEIVRIPKFYPRTKYFKCRLYDFR